MPASADPLDAPRELVLGAWDSGCGEVRVTGEDEDVHALLDRVVADVAQPAQEVHDTRLIPVAGSIRP